MIWLCLAAGLLIGFVLGFLAAAYCAVHNDLEAIEQGFIKLCGRIFLLEEIQQ